jgi:3-hydroxypropanoate dehydrogenase
MSTAATDTVPASAIFTEAHTAYRFTDAPVTDEELAGIYDLAKFTPSAMNAQPLRIIYLRTAGAKERLLPLLGGNNRDKSASAPVVAILAADTDFHQHLPVVNPQSAGARERLAENDAARVQMAKNNAWLQAGGFILAVRAAGLDAGPMGGFDAAAVDAEFFSGTPLKSILIVNIGHVADDGTFPRNPRLGFDQAVTLL